MKTGKFYIIMLLVVIAGTAFCQNTISLKAFEMLPQSLELKEEIQKYQLVTDYYTGDIFGNEFEKIQIKGEYTTGLEKGLVKWNNVTILYGSARNENFSDELSLDYMENFSYKPTEEMLKAEAFSNFGEQSALAKNLVWDVIGFEVFAWTDWDKLKLNESYSLKNINGKVDLAGLGYFENKNIVLTWSGISMRNSELCAVIEFRTLNNPLEFTESGMKIKGRSHYWGRTWISLEDKQIEHAELFEDVTMEMNIPGQEEKQIIDTVREIQLIKLQ